MSGTKTRTMLCLLWGLFACLGIAYAQVDITIGFCDRDRVEYSVLNANGRTTFIETSTSTACTLLIVNDAFDVSLNFDTCGVYYELDASETSMTFFITIQELLNYNKATDLRYFVECQFDTNTGLVTQTIQTVEDVVGDAQKLKVNTPAPVLSLFRMSDGVQLNANDNEISISEVLKLQVELVPMLAKYDILVSWCSVDATGYAPVTGNYVTKTLQFVGEKDSGLSNSQCPNIDVFPAYSYTNENRIATSVFNLFIPTMPSITLAEFVILKYTCHVLVCIEGHAECTQPDCTAKRRRRDVGTETSNVTRDYILNDKASVNFGGVPHAVRAGTPEKAEDDICLDIGVFFGILAGLIFLMLAACVLTCYMFVMARRRREKRRTDVVYVERPPSYVENKTPETISEESVTGSTLGIVKHIDTRSDSWAPSAFYAPYNFLPRLVKSSDPELNKNV